MKACIASGTMMCEWVKLRYYAKQAFLELATEMGVKRLCEWLSTRPR